LSTRRAQWFGTHPYPADYPSASYGVQVDWAAILDSYNNGNYPGGPPHCQ